MGVLAGDGGDPPEVCQVLGEGCSERHGARCGKWCGREGLAGEAVCGEKGMPRQHGNLRQAGCVEELPRRRGNLRQVRMRQCLAVWGELQRHM
jgi:hypothetical protein